MKLLHESDHDSKARWLEIREKMHKSEVRQLKIDLAVLKAELHAESVSKNRWIAATFIIMLAFGLVIFPLCA